MILTLYLILALIFTITGLTHEILYSRLGSFWAKWNEHIVYIVNACLIGLLIGVAVFAGHLLGLKSNDIKDFIPFLPKLICLGAGSWASYSFFHNGGYGSARAYRLKLNILKGWKHESETDSAKIVINWNNRFWFFVMGLALICIAEFLM